jgi:hypothetical protein
MNKNAVIQRFAVQVTGTAPASLARLGSIPNLGQYARAWVSHNNANAGITTNSIWGSSDATEFNGLPNIYDTAYQSFTVSEVGDVGTLTNLDIRGQTELAYGQTNGSMAVVDLTATFLPQVGSTRVRQRVVSQQTIVPSNESANFFGTSTPVDCFDVDTLSIQVTEASSLTTTWYIQGSIDGEWWYDVPSVGQTTTSAAATGKTVTSGTFVRNLDVSGYRYVRLLLNGTTASPFNTLATFYGEALE